MTNDFIQTAGSFATIWLIIWVACALVMWALYPLIRQQLFKWHPAIASRLLLLLLAFPFLLSLSTSIMLFMPVVEDTLVSAHCHSNCQTHVPIIESFWLSMAGLSITAIILIAVLRKVFFNWLTARRLMTQLLHLTSNSGQWLLLADEKPVVFTLGWWRNKVFITQGLLRECSDTDIDIILHHEFEHVKRLDNLRLLFAKIFLLVLPGKMARQYYNDLHLLTESACDFAAAEHYGELNVAETLLRVQKLVPQEFNLMDQPLVTAFTGSEVEWRIRTLAAGHHHFFNFKYGQTVCICLFVLMSFALVDPMHHSIEWVLGLH